MSKESVSTSAQGVNTHVHCVHTMKNNF